MVLAERPVSDAERLRALVQTFVRRFGLLLSGSTPCGQPLALSHAHALMILLAAGKPLRQNEIGELLGIDKSNVARLCAQMQDKGHIEQSRAVNDRRGRVVSLTAQGDRVGRMVEVAGRERFEQLLAHIAPEQRDTVLRGLSILDEALAAAPHSEPS